MPNLQELNRLQRQTEKIQQRQELLQKETQLRLERASNAIDKSNSIASGSKPTRKTVTTNAGALDNQTIIADMSVGDIEISLPNASTYGVTVKRLGSGNTLTVNPGSGKTINGSSTITIGGDGTALEFTYDGSNWHIT